jgi:hypothetical protein
MEMSDLTGQNLKTNLQSLLNLKNLLNLNRNPPPPQPQPDEANADNNAGNVEGGMGFGANMLGGLRPGNRNVF